MQALFLRLVMRTYQMCTRAALETHWKISEQKVPGCRISPESLALYQGHKDKNQYWDSIYGNVLLQTENT